MHVLHMSLQVVVALEAYGMISTSNVHAEYMALLLVRLLMSSEVLVEHESLIANGARMLADAMISLMVIEGALLVEILVTAFA